MPILLRRIRILVAIGFHRASTREELIAKYGQEIVGHEEIVIHDARDDAAMVDVGVLPIRNKADNDWQYGLLVPGTAPFVGAVIAALFCKSFLEM